MAEQCPKKNQAGWHNYTQASQIGELNKGKQEQGKNAEAGKGKNRIKTIVCFFIMMVIGVNVLEPFTYQRKINLELTNVLRKSKFVYTQRKLR